MEKIPLVSICCITFNQEKYLRQTLESFLMQETNFLFEIIVHDDDSSDGTKKIILDFASRYPNIIKPLIQTENKYSIEGLNFQFNHVYPFAKGKYIAICEGDDYWTDPLKLQKQVAFLEANNDYGMVHTKAVKFSQKNNKFEETIGADIKNFESLLFENTISNLTVVLRNDLLKKYIHDVKPQEHHSWSTTDFPMWLWLIQQGKIKFLDEVTGVYRILDTSVCHHVDDEKRLKFQQGIIDIVEYFLLNSNPFLAKKIRARYFSMIISNYFFNQKWESICKSIGVFYKGRDWLNLVWIFITIPFYYSYFLSKSSYFFRNVILKFSTKISIYFKSK